MEDRVYCPTCHKSLFGGPKGASYENESSTSALDSDMKSKIEGKYSVENEKIVRGFIDEVLGSGTVGDNFAASLKDGIILCKLIDKLRPGSIIGADKIKAGSAFVNMENINKFLKGLQTCYHFKPQDTFMTVDLYEEKNMVAVVDTLLMLRRKIKG